jgi:L-iditol 2-dehydrogenase
LSDTMLAAVLEAPGRIVAREVPLPVCEPDQVLVQVEACGVCGSDLRYFEGENPWAIHTLGYDRPSPPNMILGHEVAGRIVEVGGDVDPARLGERVVAEASRVCGTCADCRRDRTNLCANTEHIGHGAGWEDAEFNPGGMAEYMALWADTAVALPREISLDEAVFLDGLGVAIHAARRGAIARDDTVLVLGTGPVGICLAQVAKARGAQLVICADVYQVALDRAAELGADTVLRADEEDVALAALELTSARGVDVAFDSTGDLAAQRSILAALAPGGTAVLLAGAAEGLQIGQRDLAGERRLTTAANFLPGDLDESIELMQDGRVKVASMVTHRFPLSRVAEAFAVMAEKERHGAMKILVGAWG